jgi:hypothetical protein
VSSALSASPARCEPKDRWRLTHHVHILEMNGESYRLKTSSARKRRAGQPAETGETIDPETGEIVNA